MFGLSRQAYYKRCARHKTQAHRHTQVLLAVEAIRSRHPRLGTRKIWELLYGSGTQRVPKMGRDQLFSLLAQHGLLLRKRKRKWPKTTDSRFWRKQYPDLLKEHSPYDTSDIWVSDITYLALKQGFVYLALITDWHSRKVLGYAVSPTLETHKLTLPALAQALQNTPAMRDRMRIHHSDRGVQYLDTAYIQRLKQAGIHISMTQRGDPLDNALAERMNGIFKQEYLPEVLSSFGQAQQLVARAVKLYNSERPHSSLGMKTPDLMYKNLHNVP